MDITRLTPEQRRTLLTRLIRERSAAEPSTHPLAYGQQALWYLQQVRPDNPAYNFTYAFHVRCDLDREAFRQAFAGLQQRHAVLRTTYRMEEGRPIARVHAELPLFFREIDASTLTIDDLRRRMSEAAREPFDLERGPVMRVHLYRQSSGELAFMMTFHHIAMDFGCGPLLLEEIGLRYAAARAHRPLDLPAPRVEYADFVRWQREMIDGEEGRRLLAWWRERLAGELPVLALPTDFPRPAVQTYDGADYHFQLTEELTRQLRSLAQAEGTTPFAVLLAAFDVLLRRHSGQDDILVGSPMVGRVRPGFEGVLGFFANPVVLRADLAGNPSFRDLVRQARDTVLGALAHQAYPFARLVEEMNPVRDPSRSPLFEVMFTFQSVHRFAREGRLSRRRDRADPASCGALSLRAPQARLSFGDIVLEYLPLEVHAAMFDLDLEMAELHGSLTGRMTYNVSLFTPDTIDRMMARYVMLLEQFAANPDLRIDAANLLADEDRIQLARLNQTDAAVPDAGLHELIADQAERTPDALAVIAGTRRLTFRDLIEAADAVAKGLLAEGLPPETPVGIALEPSWRMLVGILGILRAGGAYLPLDPRYPISRLAFMLENSGAPILLTDPELLPQLGGDACRRMHFDAVTSSHDVRPSRLAPLAVGPRSLAYVMYTSGSTGRPKGVLIEHRSVVNENLAVVRRFGLDHRDRVLQLGSFSADTSIEQIFPTWLAGGCVVMRDEPTLPSGDELHTFVEEQGVTVLNLPTAYWHEWVREISAADRGLPESLRTVIVGGEKASRAAFDAWRRQALDTRRGKAARLAEGEAASQGQGGHRVRWINTYGPTEATIIATAFEPTDEWLRAAGGRDIPIGTPIANVQVHLLDARLEPVPVGVPGELYIGGLGLARGYANDAGQTAEQFIPDPLSGDPDARLYRTGDLARLRADGQIEYLGRIDEQIKIRGCRIEPGEIEAAIRRVPGVREALVVAQGDGPSPARLVAYLVWDDPVHATLPDLRLELRGTLPDYMVPSAFVELAALPKLPNGKVDRRSLPAPEHVRPTPASTYRAPETEAERKLSAIWADVLRVDRVGIHDNFFALGGDSILSIQVVARANKSGLRLTPRDMFQHQTVAELARVAGSARAVDAEQGPVTGPVPLTPIQSWFFERDLPEPHHFNQAVLLEGRREPDASALERALEQLVTHHDALRLRFEKTTAGWGQRSASPAEAADHRLLEHIDLSGLNEAQERLALPEHALRLHTGLDLVDGPLLRAALFTRGAAPARVFMVIHHLAVDAVSWRILLEDLLTAYEQLRARRPVELGPKTTSYRQWADRLTAYARSDDLAEDRKHYRELAVHADPILPVDFGDGANDGASADTLRLALEADDTRALLHEVPAVYRTQMNDVLLTAVAQAFGEWTGTPSLLLHLEGHGREALFDDVDLSRTVGWFTTLTPIRLDVPAGAGPGEALQSVKEQLRRVPRRGIGYGLLRYLAGDRTLAAELASLRPEVSFNYLGQLDLDVPEAVPFTLCPEPPGPLSSPRQPRAHLIDINAGICGGRLEMGWTFSRNLHRRETIVRVAEACLAALRALIAHCRSPEAGGCTPSDFPLAGVDAPTLAALVGHGRHIEDIYPMSPLQAGMLFHTRYAKGDSAYFAQFSCTLEGDLEPEALHHAWQQAVDRHPVLRTRFAWQGLTEPLQIVHRHVPLEFEQHDWSGCPSPEQDERFDVFLDADHRRGFELDAPHLMRIALIRLGEGRWRLVWSHHHSLLDGWSLPLLLKEVVLAYEGLRRGRAIPLEPPRPYRDYIAWLRKQDPAAAEAFWRKELRGFAAPTPIAAARSAHRTTAPALAQCQHQGTLSTDATAALERWARQHQITLNTVILGAWGLLLSRYTREDDVVFGAVASGRSAPLPDIESMVGLFINTIPVRVGVDRRASLHAWLQGLQDRLADLRQHEHTPLVSIQRWSDVPPGQPLFESIVAFENFPVDRAIEPPAAGIAIHDVRLRARSNYPLSLMATPGAELALRIACDQRRLNDSVSRRMLGHLMTMLSAMPAHGERPLAELPLLTAAEGHQVLEVWNATRTEYPDPHCIHRLFEAQVERTPDRCAVTFEGAHLTYRELDQRANVLARYLRSRGVGPDVLVGVCMERSLDLPVALLGILKAGGGFVPLDPGYPRERLAFMLDDAAPPVLLTQRHLLAALPDHAGERFCLDTQWDTVAAQPDTPLDGGAAPGHLTYVIYTSGSTGTPRGAMNTHHGLCNRLLWMQATFRLTEDDRVLQKTPLSFDVSVWELFWPLIAGARSVLARPRGHQDPAYLLDAVRDHQITTLHFVPSMLDPFLDRADPDACRSLKRVFSGGEPLTPDLMQRFFSKLPAELYNMYGPTEASISVTCWRCERGSRPEVVPIGRPIANTRIYILDADRQPVPIGAPGELYIGGAPVGRGYLNQPQHTAEAFLPDPFGDEPGGRLYRTGDLARYREDGTITFVGRCDDQVKIRGVRIEPGEIEVALARHPAVRQAAVLATDDPLGRKRLVAYVALHEGRSLDPDDLRTFLTDRLPEPMVPVGYVSLEAMPLLPSGKVDRKALPAWAGPRSRPGRTYVAPDTELSRWLADLWRDALAVEQIGLHDDFFELGGDSIQGARVIYQIEAGLGEPLYVAALFEAPTVANLARYLIDHHARAVAARFGDAALQPTPSMIGAARDVDWEAEATLDPAIRIAAGSARPASPPASILVTGATGFLGAFLLAELLERSDARIYVLVRAPSEQAGLARIRERLTGFSLWDVRWAARLSVLRGDLARPMLGLTPDRFEQTACEVDWIYHCGALVNFVYPYAALRAGNVLGTQEVLRLAAHARVKPVHFISTVSVFASVGRDENRLVYETEGPDDPRRLIGGYAQSKCIAERLVVEAHRRGLPVTVYRPGRVTGHSRTGAGPADDLLFQILQGCVELRMAPDLELALDMTPVDYASRAIVHLSRTDGVSGKTFHIVNPRPTPWKEIIDGLRSLGCGMRVVPPNEWLAAMRAHASASTASPLANPVGLLHADVPDDGVEIWSAKRPRFDDHGTAAGLAGAAIQCPVVDRNVLGLYLASSGRVGLGQVERDSAQQKPLI